VHEPKLLILDEPTNGLDPVQIRHVRELLRELRTKHTVLLSTHILQEVEQACDRVIMLHRGRILADDTPRQLAAKLHTSTLLHVEIHASHAAGALEKLEVLTGVRKGSEEEAADTGWRRITLRVEPGHDPREQVQALAEAQHWKLRELHRELPTLEDVFIELAAQAEMQKGGTAL
jgi:ABC-2 type transport system ATP-binding protein